VPRSTIKSDFADPLGHSPLLYSYERGNLDNKFYEISEDEANQIVERIRATVSGQG